MVTSDSLGLSQSLDLEIVFLELKKCTMHLCVKDEKYEVINI